MEERLDKILIVDDEKFILDSFKRELYEFFDVYIAMSGKEGLEVLQENKDISVVVSDMRMPGMDGVEFLEKVQKIYPEVIRIMLTGNQDIDTAKAAVNKGNVFRFLNKPCSTEDLRKILNIAVLEYSKNKIEKNLLKDTFLAGVNVLINILSVTNPSAFARASRIRNMVGELARELELNDIWQFEIAGILSHLGCVTIPSYVLDKIRLMEQLTRSEKEMVDAHPSIGEGLISSIPRLESIAKMIGKQNIEMKEVEYKEDLKEVPLEIMGAVLLRICNDYDTLLMQGYSQIEALRRLNERPGDYYPELLWAIRKIKPPILNKYIRRIRVMNLQKGMILENDVKTKNNVLLAKKGQELSTTMILLFKNHYRQKNLDDTLLVAVSKEHVKK